MDPLLFLHALLLGIVEGLTEFIPVSSTGHLILMIDMIGFKAPPGKVFEIVIQFGAILSVCWVFREKLWNVTRQLPHDKKARNFSWNVLLAFLPSVVVGALAYSFIKSVLFSTLVVSWSLVIGGILMIFIEKNVPQAKHHDLDTMPWKTALYIGLCQLVSMIPGVSRSGATIMGALLLRVDRKAATEFSFFLAIPTMLAATVYDLYKNWDVLSLDNFLLIAVGFVTAFFSAMFVVKTLVRFVSTHGFYPFAYYRIVVGTIMLGFLYL